jgi:hypothetical protein
MITVNHHGAKCAFQITTLYLKGMYNGKKFFVITLLLISAVGISKSGKLLDEAFQHYHFMRDLLPGSGPNHQFL